MKLIIFWIKHDSSSSGFVDASAYLRSAHEIKNFAKEIDEQWYIVQPLYDILHKYALDKLMDKFGGRIDMDDGLIPANLFGKILKIQWMPKA